MRKPKYGVIETIELETAFEIIEYFERNLKASWDRDMKANISVELKDIIREAIGKAVEAYRETNS